MADAESRRRMMLGAFEEALEEQGFAPPGYEVVRELARGGMAAVYQARQLRPEREVALKVVLPKFAEDAEVQERFQREGRAMAALDHPGILPVYQVGEWDGFAFLVMKLARGGTLQDKLRTGLPEVRDAVRWLIDAGEAVHFAHQQGVLHRDLKPGNLLFDQEGKIYVGDFGVARMDVAGDGALTRTEALVGTPNYLAPEVASGQLARGSVAADQYGLGAVLFECLTGRRPHEGAENLAAQLRAVVDEEVLPVRRFRPEAGRDLEVICAKALAKNPDERYVSVAAFVEDLKRWLDGREIMARPATLPEKAWRWSRRHPLPAILAALLVLMAVVGSILLLENYQRRGQLLHESLIEQARAERLLREPGFRERALGLLSEAKEIQDSERIRDEAVATLAYWDMGKGKVAIGEEKAFPRVEEVEGGLLVAGDWELPGGVLRCSPAWSEDGRFLAMVRGERMELAVYDTHRRKVFVFIPLQDWPEEIRFGKQAEVLQVVYEEDRADWFSVNGELLLASVSPDRNLAPPVGFAFWEKQYLSPVEAGLYGGSLSPNERFLATTSAVGVQIWSVDERQAAGFYEVENQRIDAPTDAWWLGDSELLIQVPGALEVVSVSEAGEVLQARELDRVPGTKVRMVLADGDWVVEVSDEDGGKFLERWIAGDFEQAEEWRGELDTGSQGEGSGKIVYQDWNLILPEGRGALQVFALEKSQRVVVLSNDYRVADWDLQVLREALGRMNL
ncbi:serine/threonine-protein kinase [Roseibacillus persicicus]|uniref:serine/threonine-protein kinase n=1 Tax=Roseibacillus persicicus TaxID=454148 RepID=UPI00280F2624|nr:serine/threonine-protein kinase [Roseibacillus persicicus]MDQ8191335.1 serine/threonine-protein kinase [Roseibacillus persicicus]